MIEPYEQTVELPDGSVVVPPSSDLDPTPHARRDTGTYADGTAVTTQAIHPDRASWRSALAALVPVVLVVAGVVPQIVEIVLEEVEGHQVVLPAWLYAALTGVALIAVLLVKVVNRVMLLPAWDELLTRLGAGARPAASGITPLMADRKTQHRLTKRSTLTLGALVLLGITEILTWRDGQRGGTISEIWWSLEPVGQLGWWLGNGALAGFLIWMLIHFPTKTLNAVDLLGFLAVGVLVAWLLLRAVTV